ncbi:hypothetical protein Bbelb_108200 [Branchiostoma belcheri]|nr:hypothetical protein Bbelb_108200 [Branchiostoma belcheri]
MKSSVLLLAVFLLKVLVSSPGGQAQTTGPGNCSGVTCQNGGTCVDGVNSYRCDCVSGYEGDHCEIRTDCSDSSPHCAYWASIGECESTPGYMLPNCPLSCGHCTSATATTATATTATATTATATTATATTATATTATATTATATTATATTATATTATATTAQATTPTPLATPPTSPTTPAGPTKNVPADEKVGLGVLAGITIATAFVGSLLGVGVSQLVKWRRSKPKGETSRQADLEGENSTAVRLEPVPLPRPDQTGDAQVHYDVPTVPPLLCQTSGQPRPHQTGDARVHYDVPRVPPVLHQPSGQYQELQPTHYQGLVHSYKNDQEEEYVEPTAREDSSPYEPMDNSYLEP